jgi:phage-related protein
MGDSRDIMRTLPEDVQWEIGYALYEAQLGGRHNAAKPMRGLGSGVLESEEARHLTASSN